LTWYNCGFKADTHEYLLLPNSRIPHLQTNNSGLLSDVATSPYIGTTLTSIQEENSAPSYSHSKLLDRNPWPVSNMTDSSSYNSTSAETTIYPNNEQSRLLKLQKPQTRYNIEERWFPNGNGQRTYRGPTPNWEGGMPGQGTWVYCYKLPQDCFEDELIPVFSQIGPIYELRLMMESSGTGYTNRPFCYVSYTLKEHAEEAIRSLQGYQIRRGHWLAVSECDERCRLRIDGIPKNCTSHEIKEELRAITSGISNVILCQTDSNRTSRRSLMNDGPYIIAEYESHFAAAGAKRKLIPGEIFLFGVEIEQVTWAKPQPELNEQQMKLLTILYVNHLNKETTEQTLRTHFNLLSNGQVELVQRPKAKDFAFVHFTKRESAELAMDRCNQLYIDNQKVEVQWAKPPKGWDHNWRDVLLWSMKDPSQIISETKQIVTIRDKFPKAFEHYMILPKEDIQDIYSLRKEHIPLLETMQAAGRELMRDNRSNFMMGFHANPNMNRLHLHVISKDLSYAKGRIHWNIFTTPYFISCKSVIKELKKMGKVKERTESQEKEWIQKNPRCPFCSHSETGDNLTNMKMHVKAHLEERKD